MFRFLCVKSICRNMSLCSNVYFFFFFLRVYKGLTILNVHTLSSLQSQSLWLPPVQKKHTKIHQKRFKSSHFFLCSTVSSLAARPKSPSRSSMFSLTKKLPERDKNICRVSIPHITCACPKVTADSWDACVCANATFSVGRPHT